MKTVTIVIPHMNHADLLEQCLDSLIAQTVRPHSVVIVDNGSTDTSRDSIQARSNAMNIHTIELGRNMGFAYAVNRGIEFALNQSTDYVILLNNDAVLDPMCIEELLYSFTRVPGNTAVIQPLILNARHRELIDCAGIAITKDMSAINHRQGESYETSEQGTLEIFGATGCAAMFPLEVLVKLRAIHGEVFDESYFAYYEDVDMAWRLRYAGYRAWCNYRAHVYHIHSATGKSYSSFKSFYIHRNHLFTIIKDAPTYLIPEMIIRMVVRYGLLVSSAVVGRGPSHRLRQNVGVSSMVSIVVRAWWQFIRLLPVLYTKRKRTQQSQEVSRSDSLKWMHQFNASIESTVYSERR